MKSPTLAITPAMDRHNGWVYIWCFLLIFFAAPVLYIDVVQAALCHRLGASATVANLPMAINMSGGLVPLILSLVIPHRFDRAAVVIGNSLAAFFIGLIFAALVLHLPPKICIAVVVIQGLFQGFASGEASIFTYQCLVRGTTSAGRARVVKLTFAFTPIAAVLGSLGAQSVLNSHYQPLRFPYNFALLYALASICMAGVSLAASRFRLAPMADHPPVSVGRHLVQALRNYLRSRDLVLLFFVYWLWYAALSAMSNLSLYAGQRAAAPGESLTGFMMAMRFGCKAIGGYFMGVLAQRRGFRASVIASLLLLVLGMAWGWVTPGVLLLFGFGLMGAGELGGAYIPNFGLSLSRPEDGARNLAILQLAATAACFAPALHGFLADQFGFPASFGFGIFAALLAVLLAGMIRPVPNSEPVPAEEIAPESAPGGAESVT